MTSQRDIVEVVDHNNEWSMQTYERLSKIKTVMAVMRKCNHTFIRKIAMSSKSIARLRQAQTLDLDRHITFLEKEGREIYDQDKVMS